MFTVTMNYLSISMICNTTGKRRNQSLTEFGMHSVMYMPHRPYRFSYA